MLGIGAVTLHTLLTSALYGAQWSASCPDCFTRGHLVHCVIYNTILEEVYNLNDKILLRYKNIGHPNLK